MDASRQVSLAYLFLEMFWVALGFGFATVLIHPAITLEVHFLAIPFAGACWGAAVGGLWKNLLGGAKVGALAGFLFLPLAIGVSVGH